MFGGRRMIIELEINGARVIISGDNLTVNVSEDVAEAVKTLTFAGAVPHGIDALTAWMKAVRGRASELADCLGITPGAIPQWREIPSDKLLAVEKITGIKRQVLRPDLFEGMSV